MRNKTNMIFSVTGIILLTGLSFNPFSGRSSPENRGAGSPIPENVMKIAEKSCVSCHSEPGNADALARLNFTNWDKYSPDKQASKAQAMCIMISKDKMPPLTYRGMHPESVLTTDEIKTVYAWAQSLQNAKK
jgi:hypothetical protein